MIKSINNLQKELDSLQKLLATLDGDLGNITFDPFDPSSIEQAIHHSYQMVDDKTREHSCNQITLSLIDKIKVSFRNNILQKAAEARLNGDISE